MPRTALTVTDFTRAGVAEPSEQNGDFTNGNYIASNDGRIGLIVRNANAGTQSITVLTPGTVDGLAIADLTISIPAGATRYIGPFGTGTFNQTDGSIYIDVSVATDLKFRPIRIP